MSDIEIFVQGEGLDTISLVRIPSNGKISDLLNLVGTSSGPGRQDETKQVFLEDSEEPINHKTSLTDAGIRNRSRVHIHRCHRVIATINFKHLQASHPFPPSATLGRVHDWACNKFKLEDIDAAEHILQICGTINRPDEDIHLGTLVQHPECAICFDLVPKQRVEG